MLFIIFIAVNAQYNPSDSCSCNEYQGACSNKRCRLVSVCNTTLTLSGDNIVYADQCQLPGLHSCKSKCPQVLSEGLLYLRSTCFNGIDCTLAYQCDGANSELYKPCDSNANANVSLSNPSCLYCFQKSDSTFNIPALLPVQPSTTKAPLATYIQQSSTLGNALISTSLAEFTPLPIETTLYSSTTIQTQISIPTTAMTTSDQSDVYAYASSVPTIPIVSTVSSAVEPTLPTAIISSSPTSSAVELLLPPNPSSTSSSAINYSSTNQDSTSTTTIVLSTILPAAFIAMILAVLACRKKRRLRSRQSVLPSQDTLQDFQGDLEDISIKKLGWNGSTMIDLDDKALLLNKTVSEKTIEETHHDPGIPNLKTTDFFTSMRSIYIPKGRLKPFSAPTNEVLQHSKQYLEVDGHIPSLELENDKRRNMINKRLSSEFKYNRKSNDEPEIESVKEEMQPTKLKQVHDAPALEFAKPTHVMVARNFKSFEKRASAGTAKYDLDLIEEDA